MFTTLSKSEFYEFKRQMEQRLDEVLQELLSLRGQVDKLEQQEQKSSSKMGEDLGTLQRSLGGVSEQCAESDRKLDKSYSHLKDIDKFVEGDHKRIFAEMERIHEYVRTAPQKLQEIFDAIVKMDKALLAEHWANQMKTSVLCEEMGAVVAELSKYAGKAVSQLTETTEKYQRVCERKSAPTTTRERRFEEELATLETQHQKQMAQMEERYRRQIRETEKRLEKAEEKLRDEKRHHDRFSKDQKTVEPEKQEETPMPASEQESDSTQSDELQSVEQNSAADELQNLKQRYQELRRAESAAVSQEQVIAISREKVETRNRIREIESAGE